MHVLADLQEEDGRARVLAERQHLLTRQFGVVEDLVQHLDRDRRLLALACRLERPDDILRQQARGLLAEAAYRIANLFDVYLAHHLNDTAVDRESLWRIICLAVPTYVA